MKKTAVAVLLAVFAAGTAAAAQETALVRYGYTERHECLAGTCRRTPADKFRDRYLMLPTVPDASRAGLDHLQRGRRPGRRPARAMRCDASGCTGLNVEYVQNAVYASYVQPEGTWMLRVHLIDAIPDFLKDGTEPLPGDFVEIATLGLDVLVYRGSCPALLDP